MNMSRFSKLIDQLENIDQQDIQNTAKVFGVAADLYQTLDHIVQSNKVLNNSQNPAITGTMSRDDLLTLKADLESKLAIVNEQLANLD